MQDLRKLAKHQANHEFWISKSKKIKVGYPYTYQLIQTFYLFGSRKLRYWAGGEPYKWANVNLWETEEGRAVMHYLVDKFMALTTETKSIPIILFIPIGSTLQESVPARYTNFKKEISSRHNKLKIIDVMDLHFEKERFNMKQYRGHASPYGNKVISKGIEMALHQISKEHNSKVKFLSHIEGS